MQKHDSHCIAATLFVLIQHKQPSKMTVPLRSGGSNHGAATKRDVLTERQSHDQLVTTQRRAASLKNNSKGERFINRDYLYL